MADQPTSLLDENIYFMATGDTLLTCGLDVSAAASTALTIGRENMGSQWDRELGSLLSWSCTILI